jgi:hypothetical protein
MDIADLSKNPQRLLVQIGFAGAHYGLFVPVLAIAKYLGNSDQTRAPSLIMLAILDISLGNSKGAKEILHSLLDNPGYSHFHEETAQILKAVFNEQKEARV